MATEYSSGSVGVVVKGVFNNTLGDGIVLPDSLGATGRQYTSAFTNGTGSGKAQIQWHDRRSLLTGADETIDLKAVVSAFGAAAFTKVKALVIKVNTVTPGYSVKLTAGASNGFSAIFSDASDEIVTGAGGTLVLVSPVDGYTVDATHKTIKITNPAGGTVSYDIIVVGEGALNA